MTSYEQHMREEREALLAGEKQKLVGRIKKALLGFAAFLVFLLVMGSWYTVDQGERGVVVRFGEITQVSDPGLAFKFPLMDAVRKISVQERITRYSDLETYSRDQQPATMTVSVRYMIDSSRIPELYEGFGSIQGLIDRQITPKVLEETKTVFGRYNAVEAIRERGRLNVEIAQAVQASVTGPVIILGVQVEDVAFSRAYENSVEQRMLAEVAVERERQNLERERVEADIVRTRAEAEADRIRFAAQAEADAIRLRGDAEASAIRERAEALAENQNLVDLVKAERWNGQLPTTVLPNGTIPFIEANK